MDADERSLLTETVHEAVAGALKAEQPGAVDNALADLGWLEMLHEEPADAVAIVFGALGTTNASATALDDVVISALGLEPTPRIAALFPSFGAWDAPGRVDDGRVTARGVATARASSAEELLIVCEAEDELRLAVVPAQAAGVTTLRGVDPDAGLRIVALDVTTPTRISACDSDVWSSCVAVARRAVAQQIEGATRAMLDLARTHALERVQFGRPVGRFQAVRHRLADALVAVESLDAALTAAADVPCSETAALAKAVAGQTARLVATNCQQVLAGIGFTTEHPFHRYLKRTMLLDGMFGAADQLVIAIGRELLAFETVPTLIEL